MHCYRPSELVILLQTSWTFYYHDWLIYFNGMPNRPELFNAQKFGNHFPIYSFVSKVFRLASLSKTNDIEIYQFDR